VLVLVLVLLLVQLLVVGCEQPDHFVVGGEDVHTADARRRLGPSRAAFKIFGQ
jgi:hypothetical protein